MTDKTLSILEQTLVDTINATKEGISTGIDFASKQIPDVIQQLLTWKLAENLMWAIFCIIFIVICTSIGKKYHKESGGAIWMPVGACITCLSVVLAFSIEKILQIWLAPKVYLIEYVSNLIK